MASKVMVHVFNTVYDLDCLAMTKTFRRVTSEIIQGSKDEPVVAFAMIAKILFEN